MFTLLKQLIARRGMRRTGLCKCEFHVCKKPAMESEDLCGKCLLGEAFGGLLKELQASL